MIKVRFYEPGLVPDEKLRFAVIAARTEGKWIFCQHHERQTWEIPGGHREMGETIRDTARRELWEETGAEEFTLEEVCVYSVDSGDGETFGMLWFAQITKLGTLPGLEIARIRLSHALPEELTYPMIQPHLHEKVQGWLNLKVSTEELWDIYDENRVKTGRIHRRGGPGLQNGDYHLVVNACIRDNWGRYLLTKRAQHKGFGGLWELPGGSALAGEDSLEAILREIEEETGIRLDKERGRKILTTRRADSFLDNWLFEQEVDTESIRLDPDECTEVCLKTEEEILAMRRAGTLLPHSWLESFFQAVHELE